MQMQERLFPTDLDGYVLIMVTIILNDVVVDTCLEGLKAAHYDRDFISSCA